MNESQSESTYYNTHEASSFCLLKILKKKHQFEFECDVRMGLLVSTLSNIYTHTHTHTKVHYYYLLIIID